LYLQPVVAKPRLTVAALVDLICIDVEAAVSEDVAETEVVASHCRVSTPVECRDVGTAKFSGDKPSGFVVIEQDSLEALSRERFPAVKTPADISGYGARIVPKLHDDFGYVGWARGCVYRSRFSDELPHIAGAEAVVFGYVGWIIEEVHRLIPEDMEGQLSPSWGGAMLGQTQTTLRARVLSNYTLKLRAYRDLRGETSVLTLVAAKSH
jgi:hypothetical protein